MRVQRVNLNIPRNKNYHKPFIYNEALDFMKKAKVGGVISNEGVRMDGVPISFLKLLNKAKIYFNLINR